MLIRINKMIFIETVSFNGWKKLYLKYYIELKKTEVIEFIYYKRSCTILMNFGAIFRLSRFVVSNIFGAFNGKQYFYPSEMCNTCVFAVDLHQRYIIMRGIFLFIFIPNQNKIVTIFSYFIFFFWKSRGS